MSLLFKKILVSFVLLSFFMIVFFSFTLMIHEPDGNMSRKCLFSTTEASFCPQDVLIMVFHHISSYQSFINIPTNFGATTLSIFLLFIAFIILIIFTNLSQLKLFAPVKISYSPSPKILHKRKIIHWVALHENSPTVF